MVLFETGTDVWRYQHQKNTLNKCYTISKQISTHHSSLGLNSYNVKNSDQLAIFATEHLINTAITAAQHSHLPLLLF